MRKIQILVASVGAIGLIGALGACSDDSSNDSSSGDATTTATAGDASATTGGGDVSVTVDGQAQELASSTVVCSDAAGKFAISIGDATGNGHTGVVVTLASSDSSEVESVSIGSTNGKALAWVKGTPTGDAKASKDGKTYTVTGNATSADMSDMASAGAKKSFEIKVTCP